MKKSKAVAFTKKDQSGRRGWDVSWVDDYYGPMGQVMRCRRKDLIKKTITNINIPVHLK